MILFKAINYKENLPQKLTSKFNGKYKEESCFEDIIKTAFTHISHGDRKKEKDYWISTTKDINIAIELMNNSDYDYNGIAIIELPETEETGFIYDKCLMEKGYIEKEIINDKAKQKWNTNNDGIVLSLDMSSMYTINYLASYLWLKGNREALGNIRMYLNANSKDEVLLLGENITFKFIPKEEIKQYEVTYKIIYKKKDIIDYNSILYRFFLELAPESDLKKELIDFQGRIFNELNVKQYTYNEIDDKRKELIGSFYENAKYTFCRERAKIYFYNSIKSLYEDKKKLEQNKYKFIKLYDDSEVSFDYYLWSYICSGAYIYLKLQGKIKEQTLIFRIVNKLYNCVVIDGKVHKDQFFKYYTKGLGIYPSVEPKKQISLNDYDIGF